MPKVNGAVELVDFLTKGVGTNFLGSQMEAFSESHVVRPNVTLSVECQFISAGNIHCRVEIEQGNTCPRPEVEGLPCADMEVPEDATSLVIQNSVMHIKEFYLIPSAFARIKVKGLGGNDATTRLVKLRVCGRPNGHSNGGGPPGIGG